MEFTCKIIRAWCFFFFGQLFNLLSDIINNYRLASSYQIDKSIYYSFLRDYFIFENFKIYCQFVISSFLCNLWVLLLCSVPLPNIVSLFLCSFSLSLFRDQLQDLLFPSAAFLFPLLLLLLFFASTLIIFFFFIFFQVCFVSLIVTSLVGSLPQAHRFLAFLYSNIFIKNALYFPLDSVLAASKF